MKKTVATALALAVMSFVISCSKSDDQPGSNPPGNACDGVPKTFSADVNPLVQTFCNQSGCHATGSTNGPGPLTNYSQVFNNRAAIREAVQSGIMPQNTTLTAAQKKIIICWIDSGAPNN